MSVKKYPNGGKPDRPSYGDFGDFFSKLMSGMPNITGSDIYSDEYINKQADNYVKELKDNRKWYQYNTKSYYRRMRKDKVNQLRNKRRDFNNDLEEQRPITDAMIGMFDLMQLQKDSREAAYKKQYRDMNSYIVDSTRYPVMEDGGIIQKLNQNKVIRGMSDKQKQTLGIFLQDETLQDEFYKQYVQKTVEPAFNRLRKKKSSLSDNEIRYLIHHQGARGAAHYIDNGQVLPSVLKRNKNANKEIDIALSKISNDIPYTEQLVNIESSGKHDAVYTGDQNSSAIGKYQFLAKTHYDDIENFVNSYTRDTTDKEESPSFYVPGKQVQIDNTYVNKVLPNNIDFKDNTTKGYESIVDYLKDNGIDSSYSNRKKIADQLGIDNYSGTAEQNIEMLRRLPKAQFGGMFSILNSLPKNYLDAKKTNNYLQEVLSKFNQLQIFEDGGTVGNINEPKYSILQGLIPIQAEIGENILLPNGEVVDSNAVSRHKKMDDNEVTDFLPEGSYVFSKHGKVKIKKSEAKELVIEEDNKPYALFTKGVVPKSHTLDRYVKAKEDAPADVVDRIKKDFNTLDYNDIFTKMTNEENKSNRLPWIQGVMMSSELDKASKGISGVKFESGGVVRGLVPKADGGFDFIPPLIKTLSDIGFGIYNAYKINKNEKRSLRDIDKWQGVSKSRLGNKAAASAIGYLAQDPNKIYRDQEFSQLPTRVPQQYLDYQVNKAYANRPLLEGLSAAQAAQLNAQYDANISNQISDYALQTGLQDVALKTNALKYADVGRNTNILGRTEAFNATRANTNALIGGVASTAAGYYGDLQNLATQALQSKMAARGQALTGILQNNYALQQNLANTAALFYRGFINNPSPQEVINKYEGTQLYGSTTPLPTRTSYLEVPTREIKRPK